MSDASPIPAATLILIRDTVAGPPELLMVERASTMAFAAGAMVFPGGRVDEDDHRVAHGSDLADAAARVAAVRETIEETAVAIGLSPLPSPELALTLQHALLAGTPFSTLLERHRLRLDLAGLILFTHWLPFHRLARRFDTLFFLARAPAGAWRPTVGEQENAKAEWLTAVEALRRAEAGEASLIFPTRCTLERLALHADYAALADDAARHPPVMISPAIETVDGVRMLTIPTDLGFPMTSAPIDSVARG